MLKRRDLIIYHCNYESYPHQIVDNFFNLFFKKHLTSLVICITIYV